MEIKAGNVYYSKSLKVYVKVKYVSGGYAYVLDRQRNSYSVPVFDLVREGQ